MTWTWIGTAGGQAAARYERLFREARRHFNDEVHAIFARHAADGLLQSGKTIKVVVRAFDETTAAGIGDALGGIAAVTEHAGRRRKRLIELLSASLAVHHDLVAAQASEAIAKIGLGADFQHAVPLIEAAKVRHCEKIVDFGEGWTAPAGKPWKERRPILWTIIVGLIGAVIGISGKALIDGIGATQAQGSAPTPVVAPDVAHGPKESQPVAANSL